jgi:hypothetical protein
VADARRAIELGATQLRSALQLKRSDG